MPAATDPRILAIEALGLRRRRALFGRCFEGALEGQAVRLVVYTKAVTQLSFRLRIINVRRDVIVRGTNNFGAMPIDREPPTGDAAFDAECRASGPEPLLRAALSAGIRETITRYAQNLTIYRGRLELRAMTDQAASQIVADLRALARFVSRLRMPKDAIAAHLLENATHDPCFGVRVACVRSLTKLGHATAASAIELCNVIERDRLVAHADFDRACLDGGGAEVRHAALTASVVVGDETWTPKIVERLGTDDSEEVLLAACHALARFGSANAITPLANLERRGPSRAVREAVSSAVAEIRSRVEGVERGRVSIAADDGGQLAIATSPGSLSTTESSDADE
ncbi:MAG: HEAT repeat domain-containing protein [Deltaproteobacteria bacterium]